MTVSADAAVRESFGARLQGPPTALEIRGAASNHDLQPCANGRATLGRDRVSQLSWRRRHPENVTLCHHECFPHPGSPKRRRKCGARCARLSRV